MKIYIIFLVVILFVSHVPMHLFAHASDKEKNTQGIEKKSVKSIFVGYGHVFFTHKTNIEKENESVEGSISNQGLSLGWKSIEHFYKIPTFNSGFGYYVSGNTIIGFSSSAYGQKPRSSSTKNIDGVSISDTIVLSFTKRGIVKNISQNISFGINFYSKASLLLTNIGIGPSINFLFYDISKEGTRFMNAIGIGGAFDIELHFPMSRLVDIPFGIHVSYYPFNFNSFNRTFKYEIQSLLLASVQLGIAFKY